MTYDELTKTVSEALAGGKIGTPVSLRLHVQAPVSQGELTAALSSAAQLAEIVFAAQPSHLSARRDSAARQLNVLLNYAAGQTALLTFYRGVAEAGELHLLLVGNHGVLRLEGAELFEDGSSSQTADGAAWSALVEASLHQQAAVPLK